MIRSLQKPLYLLAISSLVLVSCNKTEGPGGTSSVKGTVIGVDHEYGKFEITEMIITNGLQIEHGDYFLLNTPNQGDYYYIWYDNPGWVSNGDPGLAGRIGIPVEFNYSDSNTVVAANTADALINYTNGNYKIDLFNDVIRVTNVNYGYTPDADEVTSPFEFNIVDQGEDGYVLDPAAKADERVYLVYGGEGTYDEDVRTGSEGDFQFNNLTKGNYLVYVIGKDTINGGSTRQEVSFEITEKKSLIDLGEITIVH